MGLEHLIEVAVILANFDPVLTVLIVRLDVEALEANNEGDGVVDNEEMPWDKASRLEKPSLNQISKRPLCFLPFFLVESDFPKVAVPEDFTFDEAGVELSPVGVDRVQLEILAVVKRVLD